MDQDVFTNIAFLSSSSHVILNSILCKKTLKEMETKDLDTYECLCQTLTILFDTTTYIWTNLVILNLVLC